jgi:drug/metabolite transporter (DMT)-like permease
VTDAARTLLVACVLSAAAATMFLGRLRRLDADSPQRRIGELRAANAAAVLLAAVAAATIGFSIAHAGAATAALEMALAFLFLGAAGAMFFRDPREALLIAAIALLAHAAVDLAHRPGALSTDLIPRWYLIGCAIYDGYLSAICFVARRR